MKIFIKIMYGAFIGALLALGGLYLISFTSFDAGVEAKIVQSGSMEPAIPVGALVFIAPSETYRVGDVITFGDDTASAVPTTHRIVGIEHTNGTAVYATKGDANEEVDPHLVAPRDVVGAVILSVPYAGFILDFARQPLGFALLIGVPFFLIIISELAAIAEVLLGWRRARRGSAPSRARAGGSAAAQTREYVRRFPMDDIFVPTHVLRARSRRLVVRTYPGALASGMAVVFVVLVGSLGQTSATLSYFRDTETSTGNSFSAGTWSVVTNLAAVEEVPSPEGNAESANDALSEGDAAEEDMASDDEREGRQNSPRIDRDVVDERSDVRMDGEPGSEAAGGQNEEAEMGVSAESVVEEESGVEAEAVDENPHGGAIVEEEHSVEHGAHEDQNQLDGTAVVEETTEPAAPEETEAAI